jgi:hypothetical protein
MMAGMTTAENDITTGRFDDVCRVRQSERGGFAAEIDEEWSIAGKPNGGYLVALCANAALARLHEGGERHPHVIATTATFLSAAAFGRARIEVEELRRGRGSSVLRARLLSDDEPRVEALITAGRLHPDVTPHHDDVEPVELPDPDACVRLPVDAPGFHVPLMNVVAERLDPACLGWATGSPSGVGELRGYLSFDDGRDFDPLALVMAVDAYPPPTFDLGLVGWVPTMTLSTWVRALPAPGPLRVRSRARLVQDNLVDEMCDLWDSRGQLVATGHQLAGVRVPRR